MKCAVNPSRSIRSMTPRSLVMSSPQSMWCSPRAVARASSPPPTVSGLQWPGALFRLAGVRQALPLRWETAMKAIRVHKFGGPEVLQLDEVADPKAGPGQVLVEIKAAGVNPVDTYVRSGNYAMLPQLPYVPGADGAGVVKALGDGVTGLRVGERVWVARLAGYASLVAADAAMVHPLPAALSFAQGAAVGVPYGTAYRGLHHKGQAKA